jgi:mRNA interferase MazF
MLISKGDVYWVDMSKVWSSSDIHAQKGVRPCVIVSNNKNNDNNSRVIIVPLTTKKDDLPQHTMVLLHNIKNYVVPDCITSIPKSLLGKKYGWISRRAFKYVIKAVKIQLGLWEGDKNERY